MDYFSTEKINNTITVIRSKSGELLYLVEGSKRAVLIDTCIGLGSLRTLVEGLTRKPVTVLVSHGHIDHAMGAPEFECAYMNRSDIALYQSQCSVAERRGYAGAGLGPEAAQIPNEAFIPPAPDYAFADLQDGMCFDLGGLHTDIYAFPGHTKGCMVFLIREERILILGDACNNATFLFDDVCSTVTEYKAQVQELEMRLAGKYDRVFIMHHVMEVQPDILSQMVCVCDDIICGNADNLPFEFMGKRALIAKKCNERFEREDGKSANLIYNPDRIV